MLQILIFMNEQMNKPTVLYLSPAKNGIKIVLPQRQIFFYKSPVKIVLKQENNKYLL